MKKRIQTILTNPLFSGSAIMVIGSNGVSFLSYLYHLVMGRMLGPIGYGELAAIISLIGLLGIIPGSLNLVVIKYISAAKNEEESAALIKWLKIKIFLISLVFSLIILIVSPVVSSFLKINQVSFLIMVAVSFFFSLQALLNRSILQGLLKFKEVVLSMLIENATKLFGSILLVYLGFQVGGAIVGFVLATVSSWYITNLYLKYHVKEGPNVAIDLRGILFFTIPVLVQSVSITSIYSSDVILVKHFFSPHEAGIYSALSTLGKIIFFGAGPIGAVMFPLVSQRKAKGQPYKRIFIYSFLATLFLSVCIIMLYYAFPAFAIKLLYGSAYLEASSLLIWFGLFICLFTLSALLVNYCLSLGKTKIVWFPFCAAVLQIMMILFFHQSLYMVVVISAAISALLLTSLLIYSTYRRGL